MNETNQDKYWELAASKVHREAPEPKDNEQKDAGSQAEAKAIDKEVTRLHHDLQEAAPLHHTSLMASWDKISGYIRSRKIKLYLRISKYAALLLLAFTAGTLLNVDWKKEPDMLPLYSEITVPPGQLSEVTLYDGTHVWLNAGTTLRYGQDFGQTVRSVKLEGEAFFKVKPSAIPFKVQFKNHEVEVLGTSFAAMAYPDEAFSQVTLVEGAVKINDQGGREIKQLHPNQQIYIPDNAQEKIVLREVSTLFYESWVNGYIQFEEERLIDVAHRLERWYNVEIRFDGEEVKNLRFTGTVLKNKPIDQSMKAISMLLPIRINYQSNLDKKDVIILSIK